MIQAVAVAALQKKKGKKKAVFILIADVNSINPSAAFSYSVTFALPLLEEAVVGKTLAAKINAFKTTAWCLHVAVIPALLRDRCTLKIWCR